jgi:hypothetical protein
VAERREPSQLVGDFIREAAVLMFVLYPLEASLQNKFDWWAFAFVTVLAFGLLWIGTMFEGKP